MIKLNNSDIDKFFTDNKSEAPVESHTVPESLDFLRYDSDYSWIRKSLWSLDAEDLENTLLNPENAPCVGALINCILQVPDVSSYNDNFVRSVLNPTNFVNGKFECQILKRDFGFIMKQLTNTLDLHEAVVAYQGLNQIRDTCPNFPYYYGYLPSSIPFTHKNEVLSWYPQTVHSEKGFTFLLWESYPSTPMKALIPNMTSEHFLRIFFQVLYAIRTANRTCYFGHYNLTPEAVSIQVLKEPMSIKYKLEDNSIGYINTRGLARISNLSMSHVRFTFDNACQDYGVDGFGTTSKRSWLIQDAYMFFMSCMVEALNSGNEQLIAVGREIFKNFSNEELEDSLGRQFKYDYHLPLAQELNNTFDHFLLNLRTQFPEYVTETPKGRVYIGQYEPNKVFNLIPGVPNPSRVINFYDYMVAQKTTNGLVVTNFNQHKTNSLIKHASIAKGYQQVGEEYYQDMFIDERKSALRQKYISLICLADNYARLVFYIFLAFETMRIIGDPHYKPAFREMVKFALDAKGLLESYVSEIDKKDEAISGYIAFMCSQSEYFWQTLKIQEPETLS